MQQGDQKIRRKTIYKKVFCNLLIS